MEVGASLQARRTDSLGGGEEESDQYVLEWWGVWEQPVSSSETPGTFQKTGMWVLVIPKGHLLDVPQP